MPNKSEKAVAVSTAAEVVPIFVGLFLVGDGRFVFFRARLLGVLWKICSLRFFCSLKILFASRLILIITFLLFLLFMEKGIYHLIY